MRLRLAATILATIAFFCGLEAGRAQERQIEGVRDRTRPPRIKSLTLHREGEAPKTIPIGSQGEPTPAPVLTELDVRTLVPDTFDLVQVDDGRSHLGKVTRYSSAVLQFVDLAGRSISVPRRNIVAIDLDVSRVTPDSFLPLQLEPEQDLVVLNDGTTVVSKLTIITEDTVGTTKRVLRRDEVDLILIAPESVDQSAILLDTPPDPEPSADPPLVSPSIPPLDPGNDAWPNGPPAEDGECWVGYVNYDIKHYESKDLNDDAGMVSWSVRLRLALAEREFPTTTSFGTFRNVHLIPRTMRYRIAWSKNPSRSEFPVRLGPPCANQHYSWTYSYNPIRGNGLVLADEFRDPTSGYVNYLFPDALDDLEGRIRASIPGISDDAVAAVARPIRDQFDALSADSRYVFSTPYLSPENIVGFSLPMVVQTVEETCADGTLFETRTSDYRDVGYPLTAAIGLSEVDPQRRQLRGDQDVLVGSYRIPAHKEPAHDSDTRVRWKLQRSTSCELPPFPDVVPPPNEVAEDDDCYETTFRLHDWYEQALAEAYEQLADAYSTFDRYEQEMLYNHEAYKLAMAVCGIRNTVLTAMGSWLFRGLGFVDRVPSQRLALPPRPGAVIPQAPGSPAITVGDVKRIMLGLVGFAAITEISELISGEASADLLKGRLFGCADVLTQDVSDGALRFIQNREEVGKAARSIGHYYSKLIQTQLEQVFNMIEPFQECLECTEERGISNYGCWPPPSIGASPWASAKPTHPRWRQEMNYWLTVFSLGFGVDIPTDVLLSEPAVNRFGESQWDY